MQNQQIEPFKLVNYDQVEELASITYMASNGHYKTLMIHRKTFYQLMDPHLDRDSKEQLRLTKDQIELRACLNENSKKIKSWDSWFNEETNKLMQSRLNRKAH